MVTAAPPKIPEPLKQQLKVGGRLVIPVGKYYQRLLRVTRTKDGYREESVIPVRFVPMTGKAQER
jgi:protein-L-isoaspartate(D-aspartate) O-methyltransferase